MAAFILKSSDKSRRPHKFEAYSCNIDSDMLNCLTSDCMEAWRITAPAFYEITNETGFNEAYVCNALNTLGQAQLPNTPEENSLVTKNPAITDITEVVALHALRWIDNGIKFPYPRVLHKEAFPLQHHGVDCLGYTQSRGSCIFYIVEVMASVSQEHPPSTVTRHRVQLLDETLNENPTTRLLNDLKTIHAESAEEHKDVLNSFLIAILSDDISSSDSVIAAPVLIRREDEFQDEDWSPFITETESFQNAVIPATVYFFAFEIDSQFSDLMDLIKITASTGIGQAVDEGTE